MCCTRLAENTGRKQIAKKAAHHRTNLSGYIFATKARINNRQKLVKQQYLLHMSYKTVNFGTLAAEIGSGVCCTSANFNGFASWSVTARQFSSGRWPNFAALNRGLRRAAITLGIGPHSSSFFFLLYGHPA